MKKFNINNHIYIQITQDGWNFLKETVGVDYIALKIENRKCEINGEVWYRLQCYQVFELMPVSFTGPTLFNTNVIFDDSDLKN